MSGDPPRAQAECGEFLFEEIAAGEGHAFAAGDGDRSRLKMRGGDEREGLRSGGDDAGTSSLQ